MLKGKKILIGVSGGIAAYKVCELIRLYKKSGAEVKVLVTKNALEFVTKLTLQSLSQNQVYENEMESDCWSPEHISLADWADIFVIAPATANTISKMACGIADNLLTSVFCAFHKPVIIAPAMNTGMWENDIIQQNVEKLAKKYIIINPEDGFLACGAEGKGRLADLNVIFDKTVEILNKKKILSGKKIVITSGGTKENIDPVRYISNYSSGKMGYALAQKAFELGADVTLITTTNMTGEFNVKKVNTALEMKKVVENEFENTDILIMAAAVADYRVKEQLEQKFKRDKFDEMTISLVKNPDILAEISKNKKDNQIVVGFCAETQNLMENAKEKVAKKSCDFIVANDVSRSDIAFSSDYNEVFIVDKNLNTQKLEKDTKLNIAEKILEFIWQKSLK